MNASVLVCLISPKPTSSFHHCNGILADTRCELVHLQSRISVLCYKTLLWWSVSLLICWLVLNLHIMISPGHQIDLFFHCHQCICIPLVSVVCLQTGRDTPETVFGGEKAFFLRFLNHSWFLFLNATPDTETKHRNHFPPLYQKQSSFYFSKEFPLASFKRYCQSFQCGQNSKERHMICTKTIKRKGK